MPKCKFPGLTLDSVGAVVAESGVVASLADLDAAYLDFDPSGIGYARVGPKRAGGTASGGLKLRTLNAGAAVDALTFAADGTPTFAKGITVSAGPSVLHDTTVDALTVNGAFALTNLLTITRVTEALRLAYDVSHYVSFTVSSTGGLVITPQPNQPVTVPTFAASGKATLSAQTRVGDLFRVESIGIPDVSGLTGGGVEIEYTGAQGIVKSYDYTAAALQPLLLSSSGVTLDAPLHLASWPTAGIETLHDVIIANNGTTSITLTHGRLSLADVSVTGANADVIVYGGSGTQIVAQTPGSHYTTTAANAGTINVYYSGGAAVIENKLGSSLTLRISVTKHHV